VKLHYSNEPVLLGHTSKALGRSWIVPVYYPSGRALPSQTEAYQAIKPPPAPPRNAGVNSIIAKLIRMFETEDKDDQGLTTWEIHGKLPGCIKESVTRQLSKNKNLFWREEETVDIKFKAPGGKLKVATLAKWHLVTPDTKEG